MVSHASLVRVICVRCVSCVSRPAPTTVDFSSERRMFHCCRRRVPAAGAGLGPGSARLPRFRGLGSLLFFFQFALVSISLSSMKICVSIARFGGVAGP